MAFGIHKLQRTYDDERFVTRSFRNVTDDFIPVTNATGISMTVDINARLAEKYQHDFYGLLIELEVNESYHWACLRANGLSSPTDFYFNLQKVKIVKPGTVRSQYERHQTNLYQQ